MTTSSSPDALAPAAITALAGERWAVMIAAEHVPREPGLYAIYGDEQAWSDLKLPPAPEQPLYVGKAEESLVARDLADHFATNPDRRQTTGRSTVRRSFAALLRDSLRLVAVPRNTDAPGYFSMYGLAGDGDERLNEWMHARLTIAAWPLPTDAAASLDSVETVVIRHFTPPLNIAKNPRKLDRLRRARADMAAEAARWTAESGL